MTRALVYGMAVTGEATVRAMRTRGIDVVVADDAPNDAQRTIAAELDVELAEAPDDQQIEALVRMADLVSPAPGVPEGHAVVRAAVAHDVPLRTEIDLAYEWEQQRVGGPRPMLGITGTDGKTTTTLLTSAILHEAGLRAPATGNTERPLVAAIDAPADVFVVECSSFRLSWTHVFRPQAGAWLNLAPDHQNWHVSMDSYTSAKARLWTHQLASDVAIGFVDDPTVMAQLTIAPGRHRTFGLNRGDYHREQGHLVGPSGEIAPIASMARSLPHDITNALAAAALALEAGFVRPAHVAAALGSFRPPPHRLEQITDSGDIVWYNDSKATTPHAALTAIRAFDSVVLIAGGRNKGLDLAPMASEPQRMRAVVAIGEAARDVHAVFDPICHVVDADSMEAAVVAAADLARRGDAVVLSPGCASFDWYPDGGYPARGEHFRSAVAKLLERRAS